MRITAEFLTNKLLEIAKKNAPVRLVADKKGRPRQRAVGNKGTNMYSPYPGNLKNNGIYRRGTNAIVYDYNKVGYIGYANLYSKKPRYIENTLNDFLNYCVSLGGRITKR
jgi:hypothetical protein